METPLVSDSFQGLVGLIADWCNVGVPFVTANIKDGLFVDPSTYPAVWRVVRRVVTESPLSTKELAQLGVSNKEIP
jgi:hypothetical protein